MKTKQNTGAHEITPAEAARRLKVGLNFVYLLLRASQLAGRKNGRKWLVRVEAVEQRLKEREVRNE